MTGLPDAANCRTTRRDFLKGSAAALAGCWRPAMILPSPRPAAGADLGNKSEQSTLTLEIGPSDFERRNSPVFFRIPESWDGLEGFMLNEIGTGALVDSQLDPGPPPFLVWLLRDPLLNGQKRRYRLTRGSCAPVSNPSISCDDGSSLTLKSANNPVLQYREAVVPAPDPRQAVLQRSGYIYPVFNPMGQPVTDDFPPDHMHQHSVWFAWSRASYEGRQVNFWELSEGKGTIQHVGFSETGGGAVFGHFRAMLRHVDLTAPAGPKPVLNETWKIRAYNLRSAVMFDFESAQSCATAAPVQILEHPYGGIAIRGHRNWFNVKNSEYLTSEGKTRKDGNHTRPRWVDMYGWIDGKMSGIALLSHPENFRFPQPARLHAEKPYFCFAPPVLGPFTIDPERPYTSRYRFYIHEGHPEPDVIDRVWSDFAHPIEAQIVSTSA